MRDFVHGQSAIRVVFGAGTIDRLTGDVDRLTARHVLLLSTPGHHSGAEQAARRLGERAVGLRATAPRHVPIETVRAAREEAVRLEADRLAAIGGGSTVELAKAMALENAYWGRKPA
jgi:maleylacetate reductase